MSWEMFMAQHWGLGRRAPADCINSTVMARISSLAPRVISLALNEMNGAISCTSQQYQSVLPRCPCYAADWSSRLKFVHYIPALSFHFFPYLNLLIVPRCREKVLVLGVRPLHLPNRSNMTIKIITDIEHTLGSWLWLPGWSTLTLCCRLGQNLDKWYSKRESLPLLSHEAIRRP